MFLRRKPIINLNGFIRPKKNLNGFQSNEMPHSAKLFNLQAYARESESNENEISQNRRMDMH